MDLPRSEPSEPDAGHAAEGSSLGGFISVPATSRPNQELRTWNQELFPHDRRSHVLLRAPLLRATPRLHPRVCAGSDPPGRAGAHARDHPLPDQGFQRPHHRERARARL